MSAKNDRRQRIRGEIKHREAVPAERCGTCKHHGKARGLYHCLKWDIMSATSAVCDSYEAGLHE